LQETETIQSDRLDEARAVFYGLLSLLFIYRAASRKRGDPIALLSAIEASDFDDEACKSAKALRLELEKEGGFERLDEEFSALFLIPFGDVVAMNASVYYDDMEAGKPLSAVKDILNLFALRKEAGVFSENEDNFGFVFALSARLIRLSLDGDSAASVAARRLYKEIIDPFAPKFLKRIKKNPNISLYNLVANLAERFVLFEAEFYTLFSRRNGVQS
jgi:TorA maturation chaperone TorD